MIYKIAEFTVHRDKIEEVQEIIKEFIEKIRAREPEVLRYESFQHKDGAMFIHLMLFKDRRAESAHQQASHTLIFVKNLLPLCEKAPAFSTLEPVESK